MKVLEVWLLVLNPMGLKMSGNLMIYHTAVPSKNPQVWGGVPYLFKQKYSGRSNKNRGAPDLYILVILGT